MWYNIDFIQLIFYRIMVHIVIKGWILIYYQLNSAWCSKFCSCYLYPSYSSAMPPFIYVPFSHPLGLSCVNVLEFLWFWLCWNFREVRYFLKHCWVIFVQCLFPGLPVVMLLGEEEHRTKRCLIISYLDYH